MNGVLLAGELPAHNSRIIQAGGGRWLLFTRFDFGSPDRLMAGILQGNYAAVVQTHIFPIKNMRKFLLYL